VGSTSRLSLVFWVTCSVTISRLSVSTPACTL
jgi:hypothetical protein